MKKNGLTHVKWVTTKIFLAYSRQKFCYAE